MTAYVKSSTGAVSDVQMCCIIHWLQNGCGKEVLADYINHQPF